MFPFLALILTVRPIYFLHFLYLEIADIFSTSFFSWLSIICSEQDYGANLDILTKKRRIDLRKHPDDLWRVSAAESTVNLSKCGSIRPAACICSSNPDHIKEVLLTKQQHFHKAKGLQTAKAVVGEGVLTSESDKHLRQRRLLQPAFRKDRITAYADAMVKHAERMLQDWRDGQERVISDDMIQLTLEIITETMFGTQLEEGIEEIGKAIEAGMKYVSRRATSFPTCLQTCRPRAIGSLGKPRGFWTMSSFRLSNGAASRRAIRRAKDERICCRCCLRPVTRRTAAA